MQCPPRGGHRGRPEILISGKSWAGKLDQRRVEISRPWRNGRPLQCRFLLVSGWGRKAVWIFTWWAQEHRTLSGSSASPPGQLSTALLQLPGQLSSWLPTEGTQEVWLAGGQGPVATAVPWHGGRSPLEGWLVASAEPPPLGEAVLRLSLRSLACRDSRGLTWRLAQVTGLVYLPALGEHSVARLVHLFLLCLVHDSGGLI